MEALKQFPSELDFVEWLDVTGYIYNIAISMSSQCMPQSPATLDVGLLQQRITQVLIRICRRALWNAAAHKKGRSA